MGSLFDNIERTPPKPPDAALSKAQREAVEYDGGPMIVLAGPGTGKTRVITHRIAHMIRERGVRPERIVAMSFTVKSAQQLRERLREVMRGDGRKGQEAAELVNAGTVHGFGLRLLRRFGDWMDLVPLRGPGTGDAEGSRRRGSLMDSAQVKRALRRLILESDVEMAERALGVDALVDDAIRWFEFLTNRGIDPAGATAMATRWVQEARSGRDLGGQALLDQAAEAERAKSTRFARIAKLYVDFDALKRRSGWYVFGDLVMLPTRLLKEKSAVGAIVRQEYTHVLWDEFQDSNLGQLDFLRSLAPPAAYDGGSQSDVCVVGDDDQSIYGWRGADDRVFSRFSSIWKGCKQVQLRENHRSLPRVIDASNWIIQQSSSRFAPNKVIEFPAGKSKGTGAGAGIVQCVTHADTTGDGQVIAAMIRLARAEDVKAGRTPSYDKFAVVGRTNSHLDRIEEALRLEGIPVLRLGSRLSSEDEGVKDAMAWLRGIAEPKETHHARRLLLRPPLGTDAIRVRVQALEQEYRALRSRVRAGEPGAEDPGEFAAWLESKCSAEEGVVAEAVRKLAAWHHHFSAMATTETAAQVVRTIVSETGLAHADLPDERTRAARMASVVGLLKFAADRQPRLPAPGGVREFLEYFDDLSKDDQAMDQESEEDRIEGSGTGEVERPDAVMVLTAHKAKGLEFDTVFVPRIGPRPGAFGAPARAEDELQIPTELLNAQLRAMLGSGVEASSESKEERAEERRLFYVACTRAEQRLVLLSQAQKTRSSSLHMFQELTMDSGLVPKQVIELLKEDDVLAQAARMDGSGLAAVVAAKEDAVRQAEHRGGGGAERQVRREIVERARREVRLEAAGLLSMADRTEVPGVELSEIAGGLALTAQKMQLIAGLQAGQTPTVPAEVRGYAEALQKRLKEADPKSAGPALHALKAPLLLSYTHLASYKRCPACFYCEYALAYRGESGPQQTLGQVVHRALEKFYRRFQEADAEGERLPGVDDAIAITREEYFKSLAEGEPADEKMLDQALSQVALAVTELHEPNVQVLELESPIALSYRCGGEEADAAPHTIRTRIDRIDQVVLPDGSAGFRIIDYKTGWARRSLLQPEKDDLQLGVYTLALQQRFGAEEVVGPVRGVAEYWMLSTGERGQISLDAIDLAKVRAEIDEIIGGMLAGRFASKKGCEGVCSVLGM